MENIDKAIKVLEAIKQNKSIYDSNSKEYISGPNSHMRTFEPIEKQIDLLANLKIEEYVYRPYATSEEFIQAQKEHGFYFKYNNNKFSAYYFPSIMDREGVSGSGFCITYKDLYKNYIWKDGSKCGIKMDN